jgi:putative transposase
VGGGLIRSMGGWSQVLSLRRKGDQVSSDQRILGSGEFVEELLLEAEKRERETLRLSRRVRGLDELMREMVKGERIEEGVLRSGGRRKEVIRVRRLFCQLAVRRMGYPGAEVARYLGVTTSAVNRLAASEESREVLKYA